MAISLPNGALVAIANAYGTVTPITAITNALPGEATATNTLAAGGYVEVTSGWSRLNSRIVRTAAPTGTTFDLEGYDTTSVATYPAGGGVGSFRSITGWTQLQQILTSTSNGGDQAFLNYQLLEGQMQLRIPTIKNAAGLTLSIADDPSLAGYILAAAANDDRLPRAIKITLPNGSIIVYNAYVSLEPTPSLTVNQIVAVQCTLSFLNLPVRYVS